MPDASARLFLSLLPAVSELTTMSGKALLPGFADDDEDQEDQIKQSEADITTLFRECERRLKEMGRTKSEGSADEVRLWHTLPFLLMFSSSHTLVLCVPAAECSSEHREAGRTAVAGFGTRVQFSLTSTSG